MFIDIISSDVAKREETNKTHEELVMDYRRKNTQLKDEIKSKLSSITK